MKNLSKIINNLDLTKQDDHTLQNKIPPVVKSIVDSLFDQLAFVFPACKYTWDTEEKIRGAKKEWVKAFFENEITTKEQIATGLRKARQMDSDFLPSCGKFVSWCTPSPEDMGWPSETEALKKCIEYRSNKKLFGDNAKYCRPMIIELCKGVDWWLMSNVSSQNERKKADIHFGQCYMSLLNSGYIEPLENNHERLPTQETVKDGMSEQQVADKIKRDCGHISDIKSMFKKAKQLNNKD